MIRGSNTACWIFIKPRQNSAITVYLKNKSEEEERHSAMEASSRSAEVAAIKQESERDKSSDGDEDFKREGSIKVPIVSEGERSTMELDVVTSSSSLNDEDEELGSARAEMGEVREENQRLKMCLDLIMKDYRTLKMQFDDIVQQDGKKKKQRAETDREVEETELVSLTLGRFPSGEKKIIERTINSHQLIKENDQQISEQDLTLGLDCQANGSRLSDKTKALSPKERSPSLNSEKEIKEGEGEEPWLPSKGLKTMRSGEDDVEQQNPPKKARVCVRARCDTPTLNDGCQWRKYGQKIAKGNPCPRAYYRCTGAPSCPVRKQVQRCAEEMSILITTYEGTHNHPLSVSATAMASTTSAAAAMLLSGSSSSRSSPNPATATANTAPANLHGLNFYLSDGSNSKQFFLPNSSISSSSPTHPTITLDLTLNPSSSSSSHFSRLNPLKYPFTSLDFASSQSNVMPWSNGFLGYGNQPPYNRSQMGPLEIGGIALQNNIYKNFMQKPSNSLVPVPVPVAPPRHPLPDTIAAATKAITSDPSFQSVLAAALTSFVGNGGGGSGGGGGSENVSEKLKWMEKFPLSASNPKGNGCGSSFINTAPTKNSQPANLMFLQPNSSPFPSSKSASTSPGENGDHQPIL